MGLDRALWKLNQAFALKQMIDKALAGAVKQPLI